MLGHLIKKEILEHLMSLRFAIACVLCLMVILASLFVHLRDYGQVLADYNEESAMLNYRLENMREPWRLVWEGITINRPPNPLKVFVRGVGESYGAGMRVSGRYPVRPIIRDVQNTAVPLFPSVDLVTFVGLIMSLMALVFGYDLVCGEKQRGTLRLMLSYSVPRHLILISKWIGGHLTLVVPFLLTVLAGAVIVLIQPTIALKAGQWSRLAAIIAFALLYVAAVYSLSLCVSCLTSRSATSVMLLLSIWVVLILVVPNLSPYAAQIWRPTAGALEIEKGRESAREDTWARLVGQEMEKYDKQHGFGERWRRDINWGEWESRKRAQVRWVYQLKLERRASAQTLDEHKKLHQRFGAEMEAQIELTRWIGRVSPFSCFALAAGELADEGVMERTRYLDQLRKHKRTLNVYAYDESQELEQYELEHEGKTKGSWAGNRLKPIPEFHYVPAPARDYVLMVAADAGILAGMVMVFFMLSYARFLRYDVR